MGYQEYIDKLLKVPREERHKLDRMEIFILQSQLNDKGVYSCTMCGSNNVIKTEDISEKYEDDYLLECKSCKNWEEVGNNKPTSFKKKGKLKTQDLTLRFLNYSIWLFCF